MVASHQENLDKASKHEGGLNAAFSCDVLNSLSEHIAVVDSHGRLRQVNRAWCEFAAKNGLARSDEEWLATDYFAICQRATASGCGDGDVVATALRDVLEKRRDSFDYEYPCHSPDEQRWFNLHITPLQGGEAGAVLVHENITNRKLTEESLARSTQLTQQFIDQLPGIAYVKDEERRVLVANKGFVAMLGMNPSEMIGKSNRELFPGAFGEKIDAEDLQILASGEPVTIEESFDGRFFETRKFVIFSESGRRLLCGITMDVTQKHRFIERQKVLLDVTAVGGTLPEREFLKYGLEAIERLTGSEMGFLHFVNADQETIELVTWSSRALQGCTAAFDNHYPIGKAGIWADCARAKRPVIFNDYAQYSAKKGLPEGHVTLVRLLTVPVIEEGKVRVILGVGNKRSDYDDIDVSTAQIVGNDLWRIARRVRAEAELKQRVAELSELNLMLDKTNNMLVQSEKLAAIGQLAAGVAHEINNPVGYVSSNLNTLSDYVESLLAIDKSYGDLEARFAQIDPEAFDSIKRLKESIDHAYIVTDIQSLLRESGEGLDRVRRIVQDLKHFAHVDNSGWQSTNIVSGLESTLNIVWNEIKYKAEIERDYVELPDIDCIPSQINQVFLNLLTNAAQSIEIRGKITLRTVRHDDEIFVEIEDTGSGIPQENLRSIFEPFYTTKPVGKGTGLGLSLSWSIINRHNGRIEVSSEVGKGSLFRVVLPIKQPSQDAPPPPAATEA